MPRNESCKESGYRGRTHDDIQTLIRKALYKNEQSTLKRLVDDRWKTMALILLAEPDQHAKENIDIFALVIMELATMKAFFTERVAKSYSMTRCKSRASAKNSHNVSSTNSQNRQPLQLW